MLVGNLKQSILTSIAFIFKGSIETRLIFFSKLYNSIDESYYVLIFILNKIATNPIHIYQTSFRFCRILF